MALTSCAGAVIVHDANNLAAGAELKSEVFQAPARGLRKKGHGGHLQHLQHKHWRQDSNTSQMHTKAALVASKGSGAATANLQERPPRLDTDLRVWDYRHAQELTIRLQTALQGEKEETYWPIPTKILCFLVAFVVMEFLVDYLPWATIKGGVQPETLPVVDNNEAGQAMNSNEVSAHPSLLGQLSVLTLNVWVNKAQENVNRQIKGIRQVRPDVICLQEVFHLDVLEAYRTAFPEYRFIAFGRGHSFSALLALLAIMIALASTFAGAIAIVVRLTDGKWRITWLVAGPVLAMMYLRVVRHHWTVAFLTGNRTGLAMLVRRETVDLDDKKVECIAFSDLGHGADLLNWLRPRGFISAPGVLRFKGGEEIPVRFSTTHLNQPLEQSLGSGRHRQVQEVIQHCLRDNEFFAMGCDLNATPPGTQNGSDCQTYLDMCKEMSDAWAATNPNDPCRDGLTWDQMDNPMCTSVLNNLFYGAAPLRWRCDYIFWRFGGKKPSSQHNALSLDASEKDDNVVVPELRPVQVSVQSCDIVFTGTNSVSDHFGVHCIFDFHRRNC